MKKLTVTGIIGKTHGVNSIAKPPSTVSRSLAGKLLPVTGSTAGVAAGAVFSAGALATGVGAFGFLALLIFGRMESGTCNWSITAGGSSNLFLRSSVNATEGALLTF